MSNSPHRWFQVSLTTLFVLTFGVAMFFAGWGIAERRAERAIQEAREEFEAAAKVAEEEALLAATLSRQQEAAAAYTRAVMESFRKAQEYGKEQP